MTNDSTLLPYTARALMRAPGHSVHHRKNHKVHKLRAHRRRVYRSYRRTKGGRYSPHTAGKRKDTSHKRIRYTKNGQPYIILGNGKARFISKRGAKQSHKRAGGRY